MLKIHDYNEDLPENVRIWVFARVDMHPDDFGMADVIYDGHSLSLDDKRWAFYAEDVILWSGSPIEDVPPFEALLEVLKSGRHSCGLDHRIEDRMHRMALRLVVDDASNAKEIAALALKTRELDFTRYYS